MVNLGSLKRDLDRVHGKGDFRLQTQSVQMLLGQVREYVAQIVEEEKLMQQLPELERAIRVKSETPEDERQIEEARQALAVAQKIKQGISGKKTILRQLGNDVQSLLSEIKKAT